MSGSPDKAAIWQVVEEWLASAETDRRGTLLIMRAEPPLPEIAAFHVQQAAEKLLKGFLVLAQRRFRKTHDLEELGDAVKEHFPSTTGLVDQLRGITVWNIAFRYPGEQSPRPLPSTAEIADALTTIEALSAALRALAPDTQG